MDTIEIILAVVAIIGLVLTIMAAFIRALIDEVGDVKSQLGAKRDKQIGTWATLPPYKSFSVRLIEAKDEEIKSLKAELNKVKFDYACEVAGKKEKNTEELEELRTLLFTRVVKHRLDMQAKLKGFGAISLTKLKPEHYKRFKDYLLTLEPDHV